MGRTGRLCEADRCSGVAPTSLECLVRKQQYKWLYLRSINLPVLGPNGQCRKFYRGFSHVKLSKDLFVPNIVFASEVLSESAYFSFSPCFILLQLLRECLKSSPPCPTAMRSLYARWYRRSLKMTKTPVYRLLHYILRVGIYMAQRSLCWYPYSLHKWTIMLQVQLSLTSQTSWEAMRRVRGSLPLIFLHTAVHQD